MPAPVTETPQPGIAARAAAYARGFTSLTGDARKLLVAAMSLWVGIGIFGVLFNLYLIAIGYSVAFVGLLAALSTVGQASVSLVLGPLLRGWPARTVMAAATALVAVTMAASAVFTQPIPLVALVLLQGAGVAAATIPSSPFLMEQSRPAQRAHLFSAYTAATNLGSMTGSLISGLLPPLVGLIVLRGQVVAQDRLGLLVGAGLALLGTLSLARIGGERVAPEEGVEGPRARAGAENDDEQTRSDLVAMMAATACIALSLGVVYPLLNVYFATVHHASTATIGLLYAASGVCCTLGSLLGPVAARRGSLAGLVALRALTAPILLLFWIHPALAVVCAAYIGRNILGQITGTLENTFTMELVQPRFRGAVANWRTFSFNAGWTVGSLVAGVVVARYGFDPAFVASGILTMAGTLIWYRRFVRPRPHPGTDVTT